MTPYLTTFIKDSSFLVIIAFVISRGKWLKLFFRKDVTFTQRLLLGVGIGLIGSLEPLFSGSTIQYSTHTLYSTFSGITGGFTIGLITALTLSLPLIFTNWYRVIATFLAAIVGAIISRWVGKKYGTAIMLLSGFVAGCIAQACRVEIHNLLSPIVHNKPLTAQSLLTIPANGFGVMVLLLVINDAIVRNSAEETLRQLHRQEIIAEKERALASETKLSALRARIHPHFLFNVLNTIAELCRIAPDRAEDASIRLSQLMRSALDCGASRTVPIHEEISTVKTYLQIEKERLGERLEFDITMPPDCGSVHIVPFSIQILTENAINYGVAPKSQCGHISINLRQFKKSVSISVKDNGAGMCPASLRHTLEITSAGLHGLQILNEQLRLIYGPKARLRIFSHEGNGTLVVFKIPCPTTASGEHAS